MQRLRANNVKATVMFFGSARSKDSAAHAKAVAKASARLKAATAGSDEAKEAQASLEGLAASEWMCDYMERIRELARRITQWSVSHAAKQLEVVSGVARVSRLKRTREEGESEAIAEAGGSSGRRSRNDNDGAFRYKPHSTDDPAVVPEHARLEPPSPSRDGTGGKTLPVYICTGGGPGFMEAANRGAADVPGGKSIGMGITLPFETGLNPYVTPELAFEYHYFFTRKFWMAFHMQALVVAPGGFGTMDELFELLTLKQTGKVQRSLPVVLIGKDYWKSVINWDSLASYGVINPKDVDELLFTDDISEAFDFIVQGLEAGISGWEAAAPSDAHGE